MEYSMKLRKQNKRPKLTVATTKPYCSTRRKCRGKKKKCTCMIPFTGNRNIDFPLILNELRTNMQLCDGLVKCEDRKEFKVHRAILSAVSPFFKALFLNTINGGKPEMTEVCIKVPGNIFSLILDYIYCGQCLINNENVQALFSYSDQLEILGVVHQCCQYIIDHLDPMNCLEVISFAQLYSCTNLEECCNKYLRHHFKDVLMYNPDYYSLTVEELIPLLSNDELNVKCEEVVFQAIQTWVEFNEPERSVHVPELLKCIRLGFLGCQYFTDIVLKWKYIQKCLDCRKVLETATSYLSSHSSLTYDQRFSEFLRTIKLPRIPYEILFAIGGWSAGSPTSFIETYDCRADRWLLCVNTDITPRAYHGLCTLDGFVYIVGGFDGVEHFNTVRSFNPVTRMWREHACMYYPRCYVSCTQYDGKIYAMGGYNGRARMNSAERYDPKTNQWELIASMRRQRSDASAAVHHHKIYIAGGFNGSEVLRSAEMYDPILNQWTFIPMMLEPRSGVSLLSYNRSLYAFGGFNGYTRLTTVEKYTPGDGAWRTATEMLHPRSNFAAVILDQMVYIIGGFNGQTTIANCEYYDFDRDDWFDVTPMNLNRSALSACVLAGLPNARDYAYMYIENHYEDSGISEVN